MLLLHWCQYSAHAASAVCRAWARRASLNPLRFASSCELRHVQPVIFAAMAEILSRQHRLKYYARNIG
jgi:hypothetical protein